MFLLDSHVEMQLLFQNAHLQVPFEKYDFKNSKATLLAGMQFINVAALL